MPLDAATRAGLADVLRETGYERRDQPFQLTSGGWSHDYVDGKYAVAGGRALRQASQAVIDAVGEPFDAVGGPTMGADALAHGVALLSETSWFSIRKEPKGHGREAWVEGARLGPGHRVVMVEDVVSTGASLLRAVERVRELGVEIVAASALLDRSPQVAARCEAAGVRWVPLLDLDRSWHRALVGVERAAPQPLVESALDADPLRQFQRWFDDAVAAGEPEPQAMAVATAAGDGLPAVRFVLMRGLDERGFVFYTNQRSRKGEELAANPVAALAFRWWTVERQVRVSGPVEQVASAESDAYFATRPRGAQISAWASAQSQPVASRPALEREHELVAARFRDRPVDRPSWWGGYRVRPVEVEFWQGRTDRLHDRIRYHRLDPEGWTIERLNP